MSNLRNRTAGFKRHVIPSSFSQARLPRPWVQPTSCTSALASQAQRDYTARRNLGLSLRQRFQPLVEAAA